MVKGASVAVSSAQVSATKAARTLARSDCLLRMAEGRIDGEVRAAKSWGSLFVRCGVRRQKGRMRAIDSSHSAPHLPPKRDISPDRSAPFQPCLIPEAGFSSLHMAHHALQVATSVRRWVAAVDLARSVDPPVEFSHPGAVYPCVGLDARDDTMSHLEDYVANIHRTLIQRKEIKICVPKQIPGNDLEKVSVCLAHVEAQGAVRWRDKANCYFKDNTEVVTHKGWVERPSQCKNKA